MPIQLPNLDDRTFKDLVEEAKSLIPQYAPEWTNHNPSDPGITIIEMFAYLTEILTFRINQVTDENIYKFLNLINGPEWNPDTDLDLKEEILRSIKEHRKINRAVTCDDFIKLTYESDNNIARVHCVPNRNLSLGPSLGAKIQRSGHVSLIVITRDESKNFEPENELLQNVERHVDNHRLLTTRVHAVGPSYLDIDGIRMRVVLKQDEIESVVKDRVSGMIRSFFHPLKGGSDNSGWPFGRNIYLSDIYDILEKTQGVDYVNKIEGIDELSFLGDSSRKIRNRGGELIGIRLQTNELVNILPESIDLDFLASD